MNAIDILQPNPIYEDVAGAPFAIGQPVRIGKMDDEEPFKHHGRIGTVVCFEYECGCGQSYPDDPMIGVSFDGDLDEFWKEELTAVTPLEETNE